MTLVVKHTDNSWTLPPETIDLWADVDRRELYESVKSQLHYSIGNVSNRRAAFYRVVRGGTASRVTVRQIALALSARKPPPEPTGRCVPTEAIRRIEKMANGARRVTVHKHFETSVDYYQDREEGVVSVYRKMDQERFIAALTRGRPGGVTASEQRAIEQWAAELKPVRWPELPTKEELKRCAQCVGMSRQSWRGSWFGGLEDDLRRMLFWQNAPMRKYLVANGLKPEIPLVMLHPTPRQQLVTGHSLAGRLAVIAVIISNSLVDADAQNYEGSMWNLNRLLPLDARRWLSVQYSWQPPGGTGHHSNIPNPWLRDLLDNDYHRIHGWISRPTTYPAAYNCIPEELWLVLEESAWFWCAFIGAINGQGWGDSAAARYIRGGI